MAAAELVPIFDLDARVDAAIKSTRGNCIRLCITTAELATIRGDSPLVTRLLRQGYYVAARRQIACGSPSLVLKRELALQLSPSTLERWPWLLKLLMIL